MPNILKAVINNKSWVAKLLRKMFPHNETPLKLSNMVYIIELFRITFFFNLIMKFNFPQELPDNSFSPSSK